MNELQYLEQSKSMKMPEYQKEQPVSALWSLLDLKPCFSRRISLTYLVHLCLLRSEKKSPNLRSRPFSAKDIESLTG